MKHFLIKLRTIILAISLISVGVGVIAPAAVMADAKEQICSGIGLTSGTTSSDCSAPPCPASNPNCNPTVETTIQRVVNILSLVVGVISVIMIIVGGLKYVTSGGESAQVQGAKNTILYAVIGLVVVLLAQVIVRFVINKVTS